jgi:PadR family transcriptional regulator, regulatory protein PadR
MAREGFSGHLDLLLLASLRDQPMHGYALIEHVRLASQGHFDYPEGTIYPALRRLEDEGLVRSRWSEADTRRRRIYALTAKGQRALINQQTEWSRYIGSVEAVLGHG